jgi:hypothetical protein
VTPEIRILSLSEPWATLVAIGAKRIETRSWSTRFRGLVAIHASAKIDRWARQCAYHDEPFRSVLGRAGIIPTQEWGMVPEGFRPGHILAVARLIDCFPSRSPELEALLEEADSSYPHEQAFGNYDAGRYGFVLTDVRRLAAPLAHKGGLGLRHAPEHLAAQLAHLAGLSRAA